VDTGIAIVLGVLLLVAVLGGLVWLDVGPVGRHGRDLREPAERGDEDSEDSEDPDGGGFSP
jgi:hypothetical protein